MKSKHYTQTLTFNMPQQKVIVEHSDVKEKQVVNLPPDTYDPLAMFARYYLKEGPLPEEDFKISIYDGIKFRTMVFHHKREQVESKAAGKGGLHGLGIEYAFFNVRRQGWDHPHLVYPGRP